MFKLVQVSITVKTYLVFFRITLYVSQKLNMFFSHNETTCVLCDCYLQHTRFIVFAIFVKYNRAKWIVFLYLHSVVNAFT